MERRYHGRHERVSLRLKVRMIKNRRSNWRMRTKVADVLLIMGRGWEEGEGECTHLFS